MQSVNGIAYWVYQYQNLSTKKRIREMLGRVDDEEANLRVEALRERIQRQNDAVRQAKQLALLGYQLADAKTYAVVAALANQQLFEKGLTLVGSHAYSVLLNTLGVFVSSPVQTFDVDVSRTHRIAVPELDLAKLLAETGITFVPVPAFNPRDPSTSFKERGTSQLQVDLLVPSETDEIGFVGVPELNAYATTLPLLDFLVEDSFMAVLASRVGVVNVRVPDPARMAIHKLAVSQMRVNMRDKSAKDIQQACVLLAVLESNRPADVSLALESLPRAAATRVLQALPAVSAVLGEEGEAIVEGLRADIEARVSAIESVSHVTKPKG